MRMQRQLTLPVLVDNWWGDSYPKDKERFWLNKLKVTPDYFKIQDPDLWKVGLAEPMDFARRQDKSVVLGIDNNLFQNGPAEEIEKRIHEYMEVIEDAHAAPVDPAGPGGQLVGRFLSEGQGALLAKQAQGHAGLLQDPGPRSLESRPGRADGFRPAPGQVSGARDRQQPLPERSRRGN